MKNEQKDCSRDSRAEPSVYSATDPARKDSFRKQWLALRSNPQPSKEDPFDAFLRLRKEEVKAAIKSTAEHCIADYLQTVNGNNVIDLLSDSDSRHSERPNSGNARTGRKREAMVAEEESYLNNRSESRGSRRSKGEKNQQLDVGEEGEGEALVRSEPATTSFPFQKGRMEDVYIQDVGVQASRADGDILEVVDIREVDGEQVIDVLQHSRLATYSRAYLEQHHIVALIEYYEKLMYTKPRKKPSTTVVRRPSFPRNPLYSPFNRTPLPTNHFRGNFDSSSFGNSRGMRLNNRERRTWQ